ncbi:hypothetical protein BD408DRAFT_407770 [Parasitella parasitica]|nr:hypothetical protein BD408DRAFT_407770 [Parasitella parasitica]
MYMNLSFLFLPLVNNMFITLPFLSFHHYIHRKTSYYFNVHYMPPFIICGFFFKSHTICTLFHKS